MIKTLLIKEKFLLDELFDDPKLEKVTRIQQEDPPGFDLDDEWDVKQPDRWWVVTWSEGKEGSPIYSKDTGVWGPFYEIEEALYETSDEQNQVTIHPPSLKNI